MITIAVWGFFAGVLFMGGLVDLFTEHGLIAAFQFGLALVCIVVVVVLIKFG